MDLHLSDKVILVAGASEGIGYGIAKTLAEEGATVIIGARRADKLNEALLSLQQISSNVYAHPLDVTNASAIQQWVDFAITQCGHIDGLVLNSGGPPAGGFHDFNDDAWLQAGELLLMSAVRLIRSCLPHLKQRQAASIIAITSTTIKEPIDGLILSNVYRSGLNALLKTLSRELAPYNIRVNNVVPGRYNTKRIQHLNETIAERTQRSLEDVQQASQADVPLGRYGDVDEIGRAATFLLSPAASYITGEMLFVDGGLIKSSW